MDILELIPQRHPMVMVDSFDGIDSEGVTHTTLAVRTDNLFLEDEWLTECGLIEHIAQSAAARIGYLAYQRNEPIRIGYIGSVDGLRVERLPQLGQTMKSEVRVVQEVFQVTLIEATTSIDGEQIASCRMKIFLEQ